MQSPEGLENTPFNSTGIFFFKFLWLSKKTELHHPGSIWFFLGLDWLSLAWLVTERPALAWCEESCLFLKLNVLIVNRRES